MNKSELIVRMSQEMGIPRTECLKYLNTFLEIVSENLSNGNELTLQNFGIFTLWPQTERIGRNPRNGVACMIKARNSVKFKAGKGLIKKVNKSELGNADNIDY